jgi:hypothetical protein
VRWLSRRLRCRRSAPSCAACCVVSVPPIYVGCDAGVHPVAAATHTSARRVPCNALSRLLVVVQQKCGTLVCGPCSNERLALDTSRSGKTKRVCKTCFAAAPAEAIAGADGAPASEPSAAPSVAAPAPTPAPAEPPKKRIVYDIPEVCRRVDALCSQLRTCVHKASAPRRWLCRSAKTSLWRPSLESTLKETGLLSSPLALLTWASCLPMTRRPRLPRLLTMPRPRGRLHVCTRTGLLWCSASCLAPCVSEWVGAGREGGRQ